MQRHAEKNIHQWFEKKNRKPLIIRGARQVGKTTLVRMCAKQLKLNLVELNLEKPFRFTSALESLNPKKVIELIEFELNIDISAESSLIFFDEAQATPEILPLLRYFYEEIPEYAVIVTGSLLEFVLAEPSFSMPVGRLNFLHLGPMTFEEFLLAMGEQKLLNFIQQYDLKDTIADLVHHRLTEQIKEYCLVGGMPEVVLEYSKNKSLKEITRIKSDLITTFQLDFGKYTARANSQLLTKVFNRLPHLIGQKLKYSHIDKDIRSSEIKKVIDQLCLAKLTQKVFHSHSNGVPLKAEISEKYFKMLFLDVGLMQSILGISPLDFEETLEINQINNGTISEQFIGQHLLYIQNAEQPPELFCWMREKKSASAEIDYVITSQGQVFPIEVKSGKTGTLRSLQQFVLEKQTKTAIRFNADLASVYHEKRQSTLGTINYTLISLPHYLVGQILRLIR